ncbi:hypothetical protein B0T22DRAFT_523997 [Podospora appendiculata]|uniref:Uncharacterized protein n=1 Tax=Podospora appendiculata TaxID=314037 RepID=A0AAE0WZ75_9PEZI|nr:hypothetical protein B0T22DRAFT_523997 [Podospora appendiculata]
MSTLETSPSHPTTTPSSTQTISFLALPAEIREQIYHYALISPKPALHFPLLTPDNPALAIGLLRANRQIQAEARVVLFSRNLFVLPPLPDADENLSVLWRGWSLERFFQCIGGANARCIRRLRVSFPLCSAMLGAVANTSSLRCDEALARARTAPGRRDWLLALLAEWCPGLRVLEMERATSHHFEYYLWRAFVYGGEDSEPRKMLAELKAGLEAGLRELRQVVVHLDRVSPQEKDVIQYGFLPDVDEIWASFRDTMRGHMKAVVFLSLYEAALAISRKCFE